MFELNEMKKKKPPRKIRFVRLTEEQDQIIKEEREKLFGLSFQAYAISKLFPPNQKKT